MLVGRNSVDADTGQVGPEAAQILDLPFVTGVRELEMHEDHLWARLEQDDEWVTANVALPAFLSVAERLCDPCKMPPEERAKVPADRLRQITAAELGAGPWGQRGAHHRGGRPASSRSTASTWSSGGSVEEQVAKAVEVLADRGALHPWAPDDDRPVPDAGRVGNVVVVIVEPGRERAHGSCSARPGWPLAVAVGSSRGPTSRPIATSRAGEPTRRSRSWGPGWRRMSQWPSPDGPAVVSCGDPRPGDGLGP